MVGIIPSVSAAQLIGEDLGAKFRAGEKSESDLQTAAAARQRALEQSIRAEKELAMKQAQEARRAQADRRAAATSAEILRRLGAGAQGPSTTAPTTPGVRTSTAQLPQTQVIPERYFQDPGSVQEYAGSPPSAQPQPTVTPGIQRPGQPSDIPGLYVGPTPGAPSGAAPSAPSGLAPASVAPPGGGSYAGAAPGAAAAPTPGAAPAPSGAPAATGATQPISGVQQTWVYIEDEVEGGSLYNRFASQHVKDIVRNLRGVQDVPALADEKTVTASQFRKSQQARKRVFDANMRLLQNFNPRFMSRLSRPVLEALYPKAEVERVLAFGEQTKAAAKWYGTAKARKIFEADPELFRSAKISPITFYERYKNATVGEAPSAATPSVPGVTTTPTQPKAAARDSKAEFLPTLVTQGLDLGASALETAQRTPEGKVAPVSLATLLDVEQRKRDLRQFDNGINQLRQQAASLAKARKNVQAAGVISKIEALSSERARLAQLVNLAEFAASGDYRIIDQIARSGGAPIRIGSTNDPDTYAIYTVAPDGKISDKPAGVATRSQLIEDYKRFYDQKYAERKQAELEDSRKRLLDMQEFKSKEEIKSTIRMYEKAREAGEPTFKPDKNNPNRTIVSIRGRPVYAYEIQQVEVNGAITYRPKYYKF